MARWNGGFALLQKIGKALMLPVSVLPIAGILLGVGSAHFGWMPGSVSSVMQQGGGAIFFTLPLIFAVAVAIGLTENDGVSAMAAIVGYVVMVGTMGVMAELLGHVPTMVLGMKSMDTGVFGGILMGSVAAFLFKRFYRIQLPAYLGFFAGKRFVPIVTSLAAIAVGVVLSLIWPPIQAGIDQLSHYAAYGDPTLAATMYGVVERLLVPFGLHHIWNVPFFFEIGSYTNKAGEVVHGDINRFFAGDPTAGILGGSYLFKMWGLPAAGLAIWHTAKPEQRAKVGSIMVSAALTSFLTGITEPLEFSFLFVAPLLYAVHALFAGLAQFTLGILGARLGFTFSPGFIEYVLYYHMDTKPWLVLAVGPLFAALYYVVFRTLIVALDLKTPGREVDEVEALEEVAPGKGKAIALVRALGGRGNIKSLDSCITRLRIELHDIRKLNTDRLKSLGASGVLTIGNVAQAIFGPLSENLKTDIEQVLKTNLPILEQADLPGSPREGEAPAPLSSSKPSLARAPESADIDRSVSRWLEALGGRANLVTAASCAETRVRIVMRDPNKLDESALQGAGVQAVMNLGNATLHLIVGPDAPRFAQALSISLRG